MNHRNERRRRPALPPCDELGPDDGIDPRHLTDRRTSRDDRVKTRQLCAQVARAVALRLTCFDDPRLSELEVVTVRPSPDSSRLAVCLRPPHPDGDRDATEDLLTRVRGELRADVAASIHRRRTPELVFELHTAASPGGPS
jgi:ribosome-binding factor A